MVSRVITLCWHFAFGFTYCFWCYFIVVLGLTRLACLFDGCCFELACDWCVLFACVCLCIARFSFVVDLCVFGVMLVWRVGFAC